MRIVLRAMGIAVAALFLNVVPARAAGFQAVSGLKFPNSPTEGPLPIQTTVLAPLGGPETLPGFTELLPFVLRAPNQLEAGSCLYMSLTGIAEFFLAKKNPSSSRAPDGPVDLSERYLMNLAGTAEHRPGLENWRTDSILLLNETGTAPLNAGYRFTKGYYVMRDGRNQKAGAKTPGAKYGATYNWVNELGQATRFVRLPKFQREVLFADPAGDQWNTGVMPAGIVDTIREKLVARKAPVHVIYNHFGYWHAVNIVGFDDEADTQDCSFVRSFLDGMKKKGRAGNARAALYGRKAQTAFDAGGGCHPKGMFYVRDSIYRDPSAPLYDYDKKRAGEEEHYTKSIVLHEYDWVRVMANHATQIFVD